MDEDFFVATLALNPDTGTVVPGAVADVYDITDTAFAAPLDITDVAGVPQANLTASPTGVYPAFKIATGEQSVVVKSGDILTPIRSELGKKGDPGDAGPAGVGVPDTATAETGQAIVWNGSAAVWAPVAGGSGIAGAPSTWPSAFPPSGHTHTAAEIFNASTVGRNVITAVDAQAARAAIGAGTGNGTSNLVIGSTGTTAMPGNRSFGSTEITRTAGGGLTSTTVEGALLELKASGGGSGTANTLYVKYSSGAYPALPASKPAGVDFIIYLGPVQPTNANVSGGIPAYQGDGPTQIPGEYKYRNLT